MTMNLKIIGASAVNFTSEDGKNYNYIKLIALVSAKNGFGSISQVFKYDKPSTELDKEFSFMEEGKIYNAECQGVFESNGTSAAFVVKNVAFKK